MNIDWSKAPEGFPVWVESRYKNDPSDWHRQEENCFIDRKGGRWDQWQIDQGEATAHFKPDIWTGEGLPPVGTVCEVVPHNTQWGFSSTSGHEREILAYHADFVWLGIGGIALETTRIDKVDFRPIRTPEQIAEEERETAINNMAEILTHNGTFFQDAARLYDAGYRLQVKP
jgi:hypothetical protein